MDTGVLLVQYSVLQEGEEKEAFLRKHPELKNKVVVTRAIIAARMRGAMGDIEVAARYARAAIELAMELGDKQLAAEAADTLAEAARTAGHQHFANQWSAIARSFRADR